MYEFMINRKICAEQQSESSRERYFLVCKSCFWCASFLDNMHRSVEVCPSCMNSELDSMPLSFDETYTFSYDVRSGITMKFGTIK
jgi:hypothetical protein